MPFDGFFEGKVVAVTGVAGVKGVWLALALLEAGAEVVGLDIRAPGSSDHLASSGLLARMRFIRGDVADLDAVRRTLDQADAVFHLAAVSLVGQALHDPLEAYRTNVLGSVTVLEALRTAERTRYGVVVTTDKVYRADGGRPWVETDPLFASGPYPISKACVEHIARDYHRTYLQGLGKRLGVGRAGNVIAGGDFHSSRASRGAGRLFADCFDALVRGQRPVVFNPEGRRPYLHGLDVVAGYMQLMSRLDRPGVDGEAFNFGPVENAGTSNAELASLICDAWGDGIRWEAGEGRAEPHATQALCWDKARTRLGWRPVYDLSETVARTAAWYRAWQASRLNPGPGCLAEFDRNEVRHHARRAAVAGIAWAVDA